MSAVETGELVYLDSLNGNGHRPELPEHSWRPIDLLEVADGPPEPPTISGLLYPGRRHLISGEPESLKSWLGLVACMDEIRKGATVFYVDFEMGARDVLARLRDLGATDEEIRDQLVYLEPGEPLEGAALADVVAMIDARKPSLVVFDALAGALQLHGLDGNLGKDVEKLYRTVLEPFRAHGAAWVALDHLVKDRDQRGKWAIGSERKVGGVDVHLGVEAKQPFGRGKHGVATIRTHKDRPGYLPRPRTGELGLTSGEDGRIVWTLDIAAHDAGGEDSTSGPWRPTILMDRVTDWLRQQTEPVSRKAITDSVTGKRAFVLQAIDYLVEDGKANERRGNHGAKLISLPDMFPVPDVFPEHLGTPEGNSRVPRSLSLQGEQDAGTSRNAPEGDDDIPF